MTEYYVAKTGNDTDPGTEIEPWLTIQKAADTLIAGDTIYIKEGIYNEKVTPLNSGSIGNYITYTAYSNHIASIDGTGLSVYPSGLFRIENKNYTIVSGLKVENYDDTGACHGINMIGSDHIIIENNYVNNIGGCGIYAHISSSNITIDNNEVSNTNLDPVWDQEMISLSGVDTFVIKNNYVHHSDNIAIDAKSGSSNGKIFKNHIHDTDSGIYTDAFASYEHDIDIYQNIAHDIVYNCYQLATEEGGTLENIRFFNNIGYGATYYGFKVHSYAGSKINITVINNVFHNCDDLAMLITGSEADFENFVIRNNILNGEDWHLLHFPSYTGSPDISIDHNLFSGISNLYGDDYIIGNPKFVNPSAADFHLRVDSPAIDEGSAVGAPNVDFDGVSRPQGAGYDIGAYEYVSQKPSKIPIYILGKMVPYWLYPAFAPVHPGSLVLAMYSGNIYNQNIWKDVSKYHNDGAGTDIGIGKLIHPSDAFGYSPKFNGVSSFFDCGNDTSLDITNAITISMWLFPTDSGGGGFGRAVNKDSVYYVFMNGEGVEDVKFRVREATVAKDAITTGSAVKYNQWTHITAVMNGTNVLIYANGVEFVGAPLSTIDNQPTDSAYIGNLEVLDRGFNGAIDEVRIYNIALTPAEIRHNYTHSPIYYIQRGIDPLELLRC